MRKIFSGSIGKHKVSWGWVRTAGGPPPPQVGRGRKALVSWRLHSALGKAVPQKWHLRTWLRALKAYTSGFDFPLINGGRQGKEFFGSVTQYFWVRPHQAWPWEEQTSCPVPTGLWTLADASCHSLLQGVDVGKLREASPQGAGCWGKSLVQPQSPQQGQGPTFNAIRCDSAHHLHRMPSQLPHSSLTQAPEPSRKSRISSP